MIDSTTLFWIGIALSLFLLGVSIYLITKPKRIVEKYDTGENRYIYFARKGKKVGKEEVYYRSGKLNKEKNYKNGLVHGKCTTYYETGSRYIVAFYDNGIIKGPYTVYEESGDIKDTRNYG
jgi:antitoxin component YwqK of YwqJK toxin-antitoxin module